MSLVPYDGSDVSDSEEEDDENVTYAVKPTPQVLLNGKPVTSPPLGTVQTQSSAASNNLPLFNLPKPKEVTSTEAEEEDDEFLNKKSQPSQEKKPVKITLPSLSQYKVDEESEENVIKKFRAPSAKGTNLFAILPPPKGGGKATSLIPSHVNRPKPVQKPLVPRIVKKKLEEKPKETLHEENQHEDDDIETGVDFFSLDQKEILPIPEIKEQTLPGIISNPVMDGPVLGPSKPTEEEYIAFNNDMGTNLDETAIQVLAGSTAKRKRVAAEIVELNESDIRLDNQEWYQQALLHGTGDEDATTLVEVSGGVLKRKHQITYLAQQAKANEQQLKNLWAQNRASRQQTQSKYGF